MPTNTLNIRHYIYGASDKGEEFLTTSLSEDGAIKFAKDHKEMFSGRYSHYSIRLNAEKRVAVV